MVEDNNCRFGDKFVNNLGQKCLILDTLAIEILWMKKAVVRVMMSKYQL